MDINFHSDEALYLQIADHFRRQIALGKLLPGHRLPAIRELAQKLGLDPGTAARAYQELERQGIITSRRGGGSFVAPGAAEKHLPEQQQKRLGALLEKPIMEALGLGFTTEDIETAFTVRLAEWRERRLQSAARTEPMPSRQANEIRFSGSHDIAIELLASHLNTLRQNIRFTTSFVGSLAGLMALEYRDADIAGAHLMDTESGEFNVPFIRRLMPTETVVLINLLQRVQGLIAGILDLKRPGITFVNRQKGSGTRMLLDSRLLSLGIAPAEITGYAREESTHIGVATLIAGGQADAGLGAESAAVAAGLDFIPLLKERYDLVALQETLAQPPVQRLLEVVRSQSFHRMLGCVVGYDLSDTGKTSAISPKQKKER
jgi:molybdate-binding protein/DNA-binding transcriptional regulator YhcF (GntR family)